MSDYLNAMLDQAMQAAETLRDCWIERTGLTIQDDPYVEDACSAIVSIRTERLESALHEPTQRQLLMLAEKFFPDSGYRDEEIAFAKEVLLRWGR